MSNRKGSIVLLFIITLAALGFSGYLAVDKFFLTPESTDDGLILVGLWKDLDENTDYYPYDSEVYWLVEFPNNLYNDSNHISVNSSNTSFKLMQKGFYKIIIVLILFGFDSSTPCTYWIKLLRNSITYRSLDRIDLPANPPMWHYFLQTSFYVESTGLDEFSISCFCNFDSNGFTVFNDNTNQLAIEFVQ